MSEPSTSSTESAGQGEASDTRKLRGLIVDWGGVLTSSLDGAMAQWAQRDGVVLEHFREVMRSWLGSRSAPLLDETYVPSLEQVADGGPSGGSPVHRLERGEISTADFEVTLATALGERGSPIRAEGLLQRLLGDLEPLDDDMIGLLRRARASGLQTALLSNSWGNHYPEELWDGLFDVVVISGRVGMRKPEARIFAHTAALLGLPPQECVMVDDLPHNVRAAVDLGMVGVLHQTYAETAFELEVLFSRALR